MDFDAKLKELNAISKNTLMEVFGIVYTELTEDMLVAQMPVTPTVHQPMGFLHGGASLALVETVGSLLTMAHTNLDNYFVFGTQVNGYHLDSVRDGMITAKATYINKGKRTQIVQVDLFTDKGVKNCTGTVTNRIVPKETKKI